MVWGPRRPAILKMYQTQGWSQARIADHYGVSQTLMPRVFKRLGITSRPRWRCGKENGRYKDGTQARGYRSLVVKTQCDRCGSTRTLGIHHENDDHFDNRPENLRVLCNSCHMSITKKKWWDAKKRDGVATKSNAPIGWTREASTSTRGTDRKGKPRCALTADSVRDIRTLHAGGESYIRLARRYGVAVATIQAVVKRRSWANVA